jgi:predicted DNA-binding helix-hairpin-helix protein
VAIFPKNFSASISQDHGVTRNGSLIEKGLYYVIIEHMSYSPKLDLLTQQMHLEPAEDLNCPQLSSRKGIDLYTSRAQLPNGTQISLLKSLLTSVCERNCYYCPFRSGRDFRRASFRPDEFAKLFMYLHTIGKVDGIFLSSGIVRDGMKSQDRLLTTAEILRKKYRYQGYLHLKILPGVEKAQIEQAMLLSDRISINLEAPNPYALSKLAPEKHFFSELYKPIQWANEIRMNHSPRFAWKGKWPSTVTQFVVGGADESDQELLETTFRLTFEMGLRRAYFSAFQPVIDTPLENKPPTPLIRQNRLYQASYLLRDYNFRCEELPFTESGNLPLGIDPKLAWANKNIKENLIEINTAPREMLLRVPGIGTRGVNAILTERGESKIRNLERLKKLGIPVKRAAPFILLDGKRPPYQPSFPVFQEGS